MDLHYPFFQCNQTIYHSQVSHKALAIIKICVYQSFHFPITMNAKWGTHNFLLLKSQDWPWIYCSRNGQFIRWALGAGVELTVNAQNSQLTSWHGFPCSWCDGMLYHRSHICTWVLHGLVNVWLHLTSRSLCKNQNWIPYIKAPCSPKINNQLPVTFVWILSNKTLAGSQPLVTKYGLNLLPHI